MPAGGAGGGLPEAAAGRGGGGRFGSAQEGLQIPPPTRAHILWGVGPGYLRPLRPPITRSLCSAPCADDSSTKVDVKEPYETDVSAL